MLKRIMLVLLVLLFIGAGSALAWTPGYYIKDKNPQSTQFGKIQYFPNGHPKQSSEWRLLTPYEPPCRKGPCEDALALAESGIMIVNPHEVVDDKGMGWGTAGGNLTLKGQALATGKDKQIWFFKIPGFAWADVDLDLIASVYALVFTTGEQLGTGGLSMTYALSIGILNFDGDVIAIGNDGCPQFAEVGLRGVFKSTAGAYSVSTGPNGSFAYTSGEGTTGVFITAYDSDFDNSGWFIFPPTAKAGIEGTVIVKQDVFVSSYVSPDGTTSINFGIVKGGYALSFGDADIQRIGAVGMVTQSGFATDGIGAAAYGNSTASFSGAKGYVSRGGNYANANGLAIVHGYNNVSHTGNSVTITSRNSAFATTGNIGIVKHQSPE